MWLPRALLRCLCGRGGYLFPRERAPGWGLVRGTCPLAWAGKDRGASSVCSVPLGKSPSLLRLGIAAKAGSAGSPSAGWQPASWCGIQARQVGSRRRIGARCVIETCKAVPSPSCPQGELVGAGVTAAEVLLVPRGSHGFEPCPCPLAVGFAGWRPPVLSEPNSQPGRDAGPCAVQMVETPLNEMFRDGQGVPAKQSS